MTSCRRSGLALVVLASLLCLPQLARAQSADRRADEQLNRGQKLFREGKYPDAIEELRAGYVMSPQPRFLYALGQAYRLNHQCTEAVKAYRDFIASGPSHSQVQAAEQNVQRCAEEDPTSVREEPKPPEVKPEPVVTPPPVAPVVENVIVAAPPHRTPVYKKWWLWTTVTGVVVVGVGLGVGLGLGLHHGSGFASTLPTVGPGQ
jgi:tetratricopeptide (TPR) repeat protein